MKKENKKNASDNAHIQGSKEGQNKKSDGPDAQAERAAKSELKRAAGNRLS